MKILVTGANGYIGTGVVDQLLRDGHIVVAADFQLNAVSKMVEQKPGNLFEIENPYTYFGKPDAVIHLAWRDGFKHSSDNHINDLPKHYAFLKSLIESGIKQICVMGSMHEVGFFEGAINDRTPTNPQSLYGISKNALRNAIELLAKENGTIFQWIRGYYIVGNALAGCSVFSKLAQAAKEGKESFPFTTGLNQYDFIDYELFCKQVAAVAEQQEINGIINCCSGFPMRLKDRMEQFIHENGFQINLNYGVFPDRPYDSKAVWGDNSKIMAILEKKNSSR